ncbi:MAG: ABC-2 family transporter protein [Alphaproteobacteria bacterium]
MINVLMMLINNLAFFFMWWVIFQHKGTINGWGIGEMALLYMAINNAFASFALFARGIQALPEHTSTTERWTTILPPQKSVVYDFNVRVDFCQLGRLPHRAAGFLLVGIS